MANYRFAVFRQYCLVLMFVLFYTINENVTSAVLKNEYRKNSPKNNLTIVGSILKKTEKKDIVALDCKMVGVKPGGSKYLVARVSIVDYDGVVLYDKYIKPNEKVTDYRTGINGIREDQLVHGEDYHVVRREVEAILKNKILVGHDLEQDLHLLKITHPIVDRRDTIKYWKFYKYGKGKKPGLKILKHEVLGQTQHESIPSSIDDARAVLKLYKMEKDEWEPLIQLENTPQTEENEN